MNLLFLGGGLWIIPLLILTGSGICYWKAHKASKSGSKQQIPGQGTRYSDENVPITQIGWFWVANVLLTIAIVVFFYMRSEA